MDCFFACRDRPDLLLMMRFFWGVISCPPFQRIGRSRGWFSWPDVFHISDVGWHPQKNIAK